MRATDHENLLRTLLGFYESFGTEVLGHEAEAPDAETITSIELFVAGELPEDEWDGFFAHVADRPKCLALLAERIRPSMIQDEVSGHSWHLKIVCPYCQTRQSKMKDSEYVEWHTCETCGEMFQY